MKKPTKEYIEKDRQFLQDNPCECSLIFLPYLTFLENYIEENEHLKGLNKWDEAEFIKLNAVLAEYKHHLTGLLQRCKDASKAIEPFLILAANRGQLYTGPQLDLESVERMINKYQ
jgi:hypothetical protein